MKLLDACTDNTHLWFHIMFCDNDEEEDGGEERKRITYFYRETGCRVCSIVVGSCHARLGLSAGKELLPLSPGRKL